MQAYVAALVELLDNMEALTAHARVLLEGVEVRILETTGDAAKELLI